jgi:hypothetical protein
MHSFILHHKKNKYVNAHITSIILIKKQLFPKDRVM